jgi:hypothetical protein
MSTIRAISNHLMYIRAYIIKRSKQLKITKLISENSICAEIGVWKGRFSREIAKRSPTELHLIDPWKFQPNFPKRMYGGKVAKSQEDMDKIRDHAIKTINDIKKFTGKLVVHQMYSELVEPRLKNLYFDFMHIDGNHEYPWVIKDLEICWKKTKYGGIVVLDDRKAPGVRRAIKEFMNRPKIKAETIFDNKQKVAFRKKR